MDQAVSALPDGAAHTASDTLSGGLAVAHRLGDLALADAAQHAFLNGMHFAALAAAAVALAGAAVAYLVIPAREQRPRSPSRPRPSRHEPDRTVAPAHAGAAPFRRHTKRSSAPRSTCCWRAATAR